MAIWLYRLLITCVALFTVTSATRHEKDDQPATLNVHIRDYCDPVTFAAIGCNRTTTPVSDGFIALSGFQAELAAEKSVGAWRFISAQVRSEEGLTLSLQNLGAKPTHLRLSESSGADL